MLTHITRLARHSLFAGFVLAVLAGQLQAQTEPDVQLISKDTPITATVGEEDGEGLWVVTADGTNYSVWTPEEISLEELSAFQQTFKNKEVTLTGDIYKDKFGNLNLFVKNLPK